MELRQELQDKSKIEEWSRCYNVGYDICIENLVKDVKDRGYLKKSELLKVVCWKVLKGRNTVWRVKTICSDDVKKITRNAFLSTDDSDSIRYLRCLAGVDWAVASAILHWFHNDCYPIWDRHARWSVHLDKDHGSFKHWKAYVEFCRTIAVKYKVDMRTLDRALMIYGKKNRDC